MPLVARMLKQLPRDVWSDPSKTFLDPTAGNGNFLVAVVKLKVRCGSTPTQALSSTYGVDILMDNVIECRERLLETVEKESGLVRDGTWVKAVEKNIVCANALEYDFEFGEE